MTELDRVLDTIMKSKAELIKNEAPDEDRDEFIASLREQQRKKIIDEIREEYKAELIEEANVEIKKETDRQKIEDLRALMWSGFFLAFFVGLAVNQATDVIGYYKGTIQIGQILPTIIITLILILICLLAYLYSFLKNALLLFDQQKHSSK